MDRPSKKPIGFQHYPPSPPAAPSLARELDNVIARAVARGLLPHDEDDDDAPAAAPAAAPTHRVVLPLADLSAQQTGAIVCDWTLVRVERCGTLQQLILVREIGGDDA